MLIGAVAGETNSLTFDEKIKLMDFVLGYVQNKIEVIVGCSASNQKDRVKLAKNAKTFGAKWYLVQAPDGCKEDELRIISRNFTTGPENLMIQDLSWHDQGLADKDILNLFNKIINFKALKIEVELRSKISRILNKLKIHYI